MIIQGKLWGSTCPIVNKNNIEVHYIKIKKGGYCSRHMHKFKYNRFIVLDGKLMVTVWRGNGIDQTLLLPNQESVVPPGEYHKFEALEETIALEIYWVDLPPDDIIRLDQGGVIGEAKADIGGQKPTSAQAPCYRYAGEDYYQSASGVVASEK